MKNSGVTHDPSFTPTDPLQPLERRFRSKSLLYSLRVLGTTIGPLAAGICFFSTRSSVSVAIFVSAVLYFGWSGYRIQFILHDCSHRSLFSRRKTNDVIGSIAGLLVGSNLTRYRAIHFLHHRFNGTNNDPQLRDYPPTSSLGRLGMLRFLIAPLVGSRVLNYLKRDLFAAKVRGRVVSRPSGMWLCSLAAIQTLILLLLTQFGNNLLLGLAYYLGLGTVSLFLARLRAIAEHQQTSSEIVDFTRSHRANLLDFLFLYDANFCFHYEHHLWPSVQSSHYPKLHKLNRENIGVNGAVGQSMFRTIASALKG